MNVAQVIVAGVATVSAESDQSAGDHRVAELVEIVRAYNDVTERLQASHDLLSQQVDRLQEQLASANAALQRSKRLAALGEMAAGIAHEIRNPLASIQLYADMLKQDLQDRPPQHQMVGQIAESVRGLNGIVTDVLSFAREVRPRMRPMAVCDLLDRAVASVEPLVRQGEASISLSVDDELTVGADADLMNQVMVNLLSNALQATGGQGAIELEAAAHGRMVELTVRDSGPGIAEADIDRIFNPFFTTRETGTGLGLAIVHRIVDAHGGSIAAHNDNGAVFTITLPAADADESSNQRTNESTN